MVNSTSEFAILQLRFSGCNYWCQKLTEKPDLKHPYPALNTPTRAFSDVKVLKNEINGYTVTHETCIRSRAAHLPHIPKIKNELQ